jgi:hypothetical protein
LASLAPHAARAAWNAPPQITGSPSWRAEVNKWYGFTPKASDPDNRWLRFAVTHKPWWANFDPATGRLAGTPPRSAIGKYADIRISVTDGAKTDWLDPFNIVVSDPSTTGSVTLSWQAPTRTTSGQWLWNLAGYKIYYGKDSSRLGNVLTLNNPGLDRVVIDNLSSGRWYFSMAAFTTTAAMSTRTPVIAKYVGSG